MGLTTILDELAEACSSVVSESRSWAPDVEHAMEAVSVEPVEYARQAYGGRWLVEIEVVLLVQGADVRSRQQRAHQLAQALHDELDLVKHRTLGGSVESFHVSGVRFLRPSAESAGGAVLSIVAEATW